MIKSYLLKSWLRKMENKGLVSIIMPAHNSEKYISKTIESVIAQTYPYWELIVVDDCSSDKTTSIVQKIRDSRIKLLINNINSGAAISRNKALRIASGEWVAFLDSDDIWMPTKLEKQIDFMLNNKCIFSYTDYFVLKNNALNKYVITAPNKMTFKKIKKYCYIATLTVMYNRSIVGLVQISDIKKNNDYAMWLQILKKCDGLRIPTSLSIYVKHSNSISSGNKIKLIKWHYLLFRQECGYGKLHSLYLTFCNLWFGVIKKIIYKKKIKYHDLKRLNIN